MPGTSWIRVSILGTMPSGEVWSVNPVWFCQLEPADITAGEALAIATAVNNITVPTGVRNLMSAQTYISGARVEARDRNGVLQALGEATRAAPVAGQGVTPHPFQTSTVTSLRSGTPGASGRGRLYWPATGAPLDGQTLRMTSNNLISTLSGVKTYLAAIEAAVAVSAGPVNLTVWSRKNTSGAAVTSIRQGDVLDTQRRRRDTLTEAYTELAFP